MIVTLAGGVGAAKFLSGLAQVVPAEDLVVVGNTGDDAEFHGLHVSPDLDIVAYTFAGMVDSDKGWGIEGDTFECLAALSLLGQEAWFQLGDRDLATHIHRTNLLRLGWPLSRATAEINRSLGVPVEILPMTDQRVETRVATKNGVLPFQEYFVKRRASDEVVGVVFEGASDATPAPGVLEAIAAAQAIIVCPSNPIISIGTILAVPGIREALRRTPAPIAAISPIVAGAALKGPADKMLAGLGHEASALGVARLYRDFVEVFVLDSLDECLVPSVSELGMRVIVTDTIMSDNSRRVTLARNVLQSLGLNTPACSSSKAKVGSR